MPTRHFEDAHVPAPVTAIAEPRQIQQSYSWVSSLVGKQVLRLPCGRICRITETRYDAQTGAWAVRIKDTARWHGWVKDSTFTSKWKIVPT